MPAAREKLEGLVAHPREALDIELKRWIDPDSEEGIAKIVKGCIALRNNNGGFLIVGLDDKTHELRAPDPETRWWEAFHQDVIQRIVSRFSAELFEVHVHLVPYSAHHLPVIEVEPGFLHPIAAKSDLRPTKGAPLVRNGAVYVRSLASNGTVSTTEARHSDWPRIIDMCFDNREADIGRFVRRHVGADAIRGLMRALADIPIGASGTSNPADELLESGFSSFLSAVARRESNETGIEIPRTGTIEIAAVVNPPATTHANNLDFRRTVAASTPTLTGWPFWVDSSGFRAVGSQPYVLDGGWEALVFDPSEDVVRKHLDFWRIEPVGRLYALRGFEDDLSAPARGFEAGEMLEFAIQILRVAESIETALHIVRALGCPPDESTVSFTFRWKSITGRLLSSWANPGRSLSMNYQAVQDEVSAALQEVPLNAPQAALPGLVQSVVAPLFAVFDGFEVSSTVVEDLVKRLLERRL